MRIPNFIPLALVTMADKVLHLQASVQQSILFALHNNNTSLAYIATEENFEASGLARGRRSLALPARI
jgi:hypothetical protein